MGGVSVLQFIYAVSVPLTGEEAYYWEWSRRPAMGYYDHPPLVAYLILACTWLGGHTVWAVRLWPVVLHAASALLLYALAADLMGDRRAGLWAGLLFMVSGYFAVTGLLAIPDGAMIFSWLLTLWLAGRAMLRNRRAYWIATGVALGLTLLAKFHGFILLAAGGVFLLVIREHRAWLRRPWPYLALAIALAMFCPMLLWNAQKGWVTFAYQLVLRHRGAGGSLYYAAEFLFSPLLLVGPVAYPLALIGIFWGLKQKGHSRSGAVLFLSVMSLGPLLFFGLSSFFMKIDPQWAWIGLATGFIPGMSVAARWRGNSACGRLRRNLAWLAVASCAVMTAGAQLIILVPDVLPRGGPYIPRRRRIRTSRLDRIYGWKELGLEVRELLDALPGQQGPPFVISPTSRALAASLAFYIPGNPECYMLGSHRCRHQYLIWDEAANLKGRNAVCVLDEPSSEHSDQVLARFEHSERTDPIEIVRGGRVRQRFRVFLCYNFLPGLKHGTMTALRSK